MSKQVFNLATLPNEINNLFSCLLSVIGLIFVMSQENEIMSGDHNRSRNEIINQCMAVLLHFNTHVLRQPLI